MTDAAGRALARLRESPRLTAAVFFVALACAHTWPLALHPSTLSLNDNGDAQLNEWIVAWVAHQLPRDPLHLFQGNIFYPARDTLAFSEPLMVPALMAAPLLWLGASPVLAYNLLLIAGLALSGLAACALVHAWTGDRLASLVAGSLFAFNTQMLTRLAHLQAIHAYALPLALLSADRLITAPGRGPALALAAAMIALAYTSGYLFVFAVVMIAVVVAVRVPAWRTRAGRVLGWFAAASVMAGLVILPLYLPYRRVAAEQGLVRSLESVREFSATPLGYLASAATVHQSWSARFLTNPVDTFFPGVTAIVLALLALWHARRAGDLRVRIVMLAAIGVCGLVLSLGLRTPVYAWIYAIFPPMQGLRAAARFGGLFLLAVAALAGIGLAGLRQHRPRARWLTAVSLACLAAVNVEALRAPFTYRRFDGIPAVYDVLAREPGRVVLAEVPFYPPHAAFENAEYVLNATAHWRPLMNGYSGFTPPTYRAVAWTFWYFPEDRAIAAMREAGVTHVAVHPSRFGNEAARTLEILARRTDLELVAIGARRGVLLYRFR